MSKFDEFIDVLDDSIKELAKKMLKGYKDEALEDSKDFLRKTKADLERWTKLLAKGDLSQDDFEWLVLGKRDLAELHALKQAGLALVRIERFRNAVLDLVIDTATNVFL